MVTEQELKEYFNQIVEKILLQTKCIENINISISDHNKLKNKKNKEALGICWRSTDNSYDITIDKYFVYECYTYFILSDITSTWKLHGQTLEKVICHELAHVQQWNHCKKHDRIMYELYDKVAKPKKYYEYLENISY